MSRKIEVEYEKRGEDIKKLQMEEKVPDAVMTPLRRRLIEIDTAQKAAQREIETLQGRNNTMSHQRNDTMVRAIADEKLLNTGAWAYIKSDEGFILESTTSKELSSLVHPGSPVKRARGGVVFQPEQDGDNQVTLECSGDKTYLRFDDVQDMFAFIEAWDLMVDLRLLEQYRNECAEELLTITDGIKKYPVPEIVLKREKANTAARAKKLEAAKALMASLAETRDNPTEPVAEVDVNEVVETLELTPDEADAFLRGESPNTIKSLLPPDLKALADEVERVEDEDA